MMWSSHITYNYAQSNQAPPPSYEFWNSEMQAIADSTNKFNWIYFKESLNIPSTQIFEQYSSAFGFGQSDSMYLYNVKQDTLGWTNYSFQQYHEGIPLVNGSSKIFEYNGVPKYMSGRFHSNLESLNLDFNSSNLDIGNLKSEFNITHIYQDSIFIDIDSIYNVNFLNRFIYPTDSNIYIAYEVIFINQQNEFNHYLINPSNYNILFEIENISGCVATPGCTNYNGIQNITTTSSTNNQYFLESQCEQAIIKTGVTNYGFGYTPWFNFNSVYVNDNDWSCSNIDDIESGNQPNITFPLNLKEKVTIHWSLEKLLEYLSNEKGIDCINNSCIHEQGYNDSNSYSVWNGFFNAAIFGNGMDNPAVSLDIVGHEWGHALKIKDYVYYQPLVIGEEGALDESFADALGVILEKYALENYDNTKQFNWFIGEETFNDENGYLRNLSNPKEVIYDNWNSNFNQYLFGSQPDTYGKYLEAEFWDNDGYSQLLSGVPNYWFYLLSEGGSGTNDHNFCYNVDGVGFEKAVDILFRTHLDKLEQNDNIEIARLQSIESATELYGNNSLEVEQVKKAWDAVGVYQIGNETSGVYINANNERIYFNYDLISDLDLPFQTTIYINNDFTIKEDVLFDITSGLCNIYVAPNSNIIIEDGATLKANRANFYFGDNASIIVKTNGNIDFGPSDVYLGKGSYCNDGDNNFWKGIIVEDLDEGEIKMEATTIENAEIALYFEQQNQTPFFTIDNSNFINNKQSIVATNTTVVPINWGNGPSSITNSNIRLDNQLPSLGYSASIYYLQNLPQIVISGFVYNGFNIDECNFFKNSVFIQSAIQFKGDISLSNSNFNGFEKDLILAPYRNCKISNNKFLGFETGIRVSGRNGHASYLLIEDNLFQGGILGININGATHLTTEINNTNIFSFTKKGIYALNTDNLLVEDNKFFIPPASQEFIGLRNRDNYGIFLAGSKDYLVNNNEFHLSGVANLMTYLQNIRSYGVITDNSGFTGKCSIFDNTFNETNFGYNSGLMLPTSFAFHSQGINDRVLVRCNNFNINNGRMRGMNIVSGTLAKQGVSCDNNTLQAGNEWSNLCEPGSFGATVDNADIYISNTAQPFEYWAHAQNESGLETTIPKCNFLPSGFLKVCNGTIDIDGDELPLQIKNNFQSCIEPYIGLKSLKVLKDSLSQHELLFVKIPEQQSAKNNLITQLSAKQNQLNDPVQQKELVNEISYLNNEILIVNKNLSRLFEAAEMPEEAKQVLQEDNDVATKMELLQTFLNKGETDEAEALLNSLIGQYQASYFFDSWEIESKFIDNINYEREVADIEKDMLKQERDTLLPSEISILEGIKETNLPISSKAEMLLLQNGAEWDEHLILKVEEEYQEEIDSSLLFDFQLALTPNPASDMVEASFVVPEGVTGYTLKVLDSYQNIGQVKFEVSKNEIVSAQFETSTWGIGTYTVALIINNEVVETSHLLVLR